MNTTTQNKQTRIIPVEVPLDDLEVWNATAKAAGQSRSYWLHVLGNAAAGLPTPPQRKRGRRSKAKPVEAVTPTVEIPSEDIVDVSDAVDTSVEPGLTDEVNSLDDAEWESSAVVG